ncbi:cation diffusion facilitator family transporter [Bartonella tamiae]|uniref:Cation efflux protein transmembrane domain-containing protein n=1 Tax=Bartonella tamiae Th239 TaxID=1094558 RepID=J0ZSN6_9HYPH|nr:cation transporter [Bartonella tamiae]EJF91778.1 hypothetical protein ME5_00157 [Bartonella tamiae Th239]EJF92554.1 hypothetical protein MEG_01724 [Bartonella tamiae Th307]
MQLYDQQAREEQRLLQYSIASTLLLAISAISIGIFSGSSSIIFDGMYSAVDCLFSIAALAVARLIFIDVNRQKRKAPKFTERFQNGFWHFEPILLAINGLSLMIAVFYGLFEAISTLLRGGHTPDFGAALWFTIFGVCLCFGMAIFEAYKNRTIRSAFIAIDVKSWIVSGAISLALLFAFIFAFFIEGTSYSWLLPFIDPSVLALIALVMIPIPLKTVLKAFREILMITPASLDHHVNRVVDSIVEKYGFVDSQNYLAKVGRSTTIEIHLILPENFPLKSIEDLDKIREEIGALIGDAGPDRWLTISFTANPHWAY